MVVRHFAKQTQSARYYQIVRQSTLGLLTFLGYFRWHLVCLKLEKTWKCKLNMVRFQSLELSTRAKWSPKKSRTFAGLFTSKNLKNTEKIGKVWAPGVSDSQAIAEFRWFHIQKAGPHFLSHGDIQAIGDHRDVDGQRRPSLFITVVGKSVKPSPIFFSDSSGSRINGLALNWELENSTFTLDENS